MFFLDRLGIKFGLDLARPTCLGWIEEKFELDDLSRTGSSSFKIGSTQYDPLKNLIYNYCQCPNWIHLCVRERDHGEASFLQSLWPVTVNFVLPFGSWSFPAFLLHHCRSSEPGPLILPKPSHYFVFNFFSYFILNCF